MRFVRFAPGLLFCLAACGGGGDSTSGGTPQVGGGGSSQSPVPIYVLVGGVPGGAAPPAGTYADARLDPGEVFIMSQDPLEAGETYIVFYLITAGGTTFEDSWSFTTGSQTVTQAAGQTSVGGAINFFRNQADDGATVVGPLPAADAALRLAARRHAGYQAETGLISHEEPDPSKVFYVHSNFAARIHVANEETNPSAAPDTIPDPVPADFNQWSWPGGATVVYETIASNTGVDAVELLWNSVYHRLPLMRHHVQRYGDGDRSRATSDPRYSGAVFAMPGGINQQFLTIEFAGDNAAALTGTHKWPAPGQTDVGISFDSDAELPDPVGGGNGTPVDGSVGVPIHIALPTSGTISSLTVTLSKLVQ